MSACPKKPLGAGKRGQTNTLRPRNLEEEEEEQREEQKYSENLTGEAGQTAREIGISRAGQCLGT